MFRKPFKILSAALPSFCILLAAPTFSYAEEVIPSDEAAAIARMTQIIEKGVRKAATETGTAHRDAHAKAHGCVQAKVDILDNLPESVRAGVFATKKQYSAWIRFSNSSGKSQDDSVADGRGMAVKLMGVKESASGTQDFVMINHPVFVVKNNADYLDLQEAIDKHGNPTAFFFPGLNPLNWRLREAAIAKSLLGHKVANPLNTRYWSETPYLLKNSEMKFAARPCQENQSVFVDKNSKDFLRDNLQKHLDQGDACFELQVQLRTDPDQMPIEDPTVEWDESVSPFITVAKISIPWQKFTSPAQMEFCENLSMNPWHAVPEQRPLGGVNRARKVIYETISRVRHELNKAEQVEPTP